MDGTGRDEAGMGLEGEAMAEEGPRGEQEG
jgi:hypothetical protein